MVQAAPQETPLDLFASLGVSADKVLKRPSQTADSSRFNLFGSLGVDSQAVLQLPPRELQPEFNLFKELGVRPSDVLGPQRSADTPHRTAETTATSEKRRGEKVRDKLSSWVKREFSRKGLKGGVLGFAIGAGLSAVWPEYSGVIGVAMPVVSILAGANVISRVGAKTAEGLKWLDAALPKLPQNRGKETLARKWQLFEKITQGSGAFEDLCARDAFKAFGLLGSRLGPGIGAGIDQMIADHISPPPGGQVILESQNEETLGPPRPHLIPRVEAQTQGEHPSGGLSSLNPDITPGHADATVPNVTLGSEVTDLPVVQPVQVTPEVAQFTEHLDTAVKSGIMDTLSQQIQALHGGHTQEALNMVSKIVSEQVNSGHPPDAENLQKLVNFATNTFDTIHKAVFPDGKFDLNTYQTSHEAVVKGLSEVQKHAFNLANLPSGHHLKDAALKYFLTNPIP